MCTFVCVCRFEMTCECVGLSLMRLVTDMWEFKISAARDLIEHDLSEHISMERWDV